jgi:Domain of unknown function (DUF1707)
MTMQSQWDAPWGPTPRTDAGANMRVSDAERNEIAETLSKHYADGRLDADEFKERLDRAMSAKTRADLSGLLTDLPRTIPPENVSAPVPRRRIHVLAVVAVVLLTMGVWASIAPWMQRGAPFHVPWFLIALIFFFVWRRNRFRRSYAYRYRRRVFDERPW